MARDKLTEYSATASENTVCGDVNIAENSALPSDMNNFAREVMSHLKNFSDGTDAIDALTVTGDLTVDTNTLYVDSTNNRVGIGTASPSHPLHVAQSRASDVVGLIENTNTTSGFGLKIKAGGTDADRYSLRVDSQAGTELFRVRTAGGVTFNGDTAAANALDDYEEGTWTPQISATDGIGTLTYSGQVGHYTKIGNRVFFHMYVLINQKGTVAGDIRYTLPFNSASVTQLYTAVSIWMNSTVNGQDFDGDFNIQAYIGPGAGHVTPQALDGDGSVQGLTAGMVGNGTDVMIAGHYRI